MNGEKLRLDKFFDKGKNAVVVAIDHGEFDGPIQGMIDLPKTAKNIDSCVDGILLSPGMLKRCQHAFNYKGAPIPIVRLNWSTVYCFHWNYEKAISASIISVADAVALGAEIVLVSLTLQTGDEKTDARNIEIYSKLVNEADRLGIPVIGEAFPNKTDKLNADELHEQVCSLTRIIVELGADMIKTFYTNKFAEVVKSCPIPILGLGAEKKPTQLEALQLAYNEIKDGAKGVVFGRNAIQVENPKDFQRALCDVVKNNIKAEKVVGKYNLKD